MGKTISYNELRKIKDSLPDGSICKIAKQLNLSEDTVRNYFGGHSYKSGQSIGIHLESGPDGGLVILDDVVILDMAIKILEERN